MHSLIVKAWIPEAVGPARLSDRASNAALPGLLGHQPIPNRPPSALDVRLQKASSYRASPLFSIPELHVKRCVVGK